MARVFIYPANNHENQYINIQEKAIKMTGLDVTYSLRDFFSTDFFLLNWFETLGGDVRLDYILASPKFSVKKYRECFADIPLSTIKMNGIYTSLFRSIFFGLVDHKCYFIANIYLLFYALVKGR